MMRRGLPVLASSIPRHVWDPTRANPNWADSYATDVADRRQWPAKRWSIGLEPRTPTDWLSYSTRNLAYAYNGALRACTSFPEMVQHYQEMKRRGVAVDLDTMNILLTRAARYEKIVADDVFSLFEELLAYGARPDLSVVETLHTVYDHHYTAASHSAEWREMRRKRLVELYNSLCADEIATYADKSVPFLLRAQLQRYRENLRSLGSVLSARVMCQYVTQAEEPDVIVEAIHDYLWDFVPRDHPCVEIKALGVQIPRVSIICRRPTDATDIAAFDDAGLNAVFAAAVERVIDTGMTSRRFPSERSVLLALVNCFWQSGVFMSSTVLAQLMDAVKFSNDNQYRDQDAMRYYGFGARVSIVAKDAPAAAQQWTALQPVLDGRVLGRFIAARDPWSPSSFLPSANGAFALVGADGGAGQVEAQGTSDDKSPDVSGGSLRTAAGLRRRWDDIGALVTAAGALTHPAATLDAKMEIFTGKVCFLRNALFPARYAKQGTSNMSAWATVPPDVAQLIFELLQALKTEMDVFIAANPSAVPELEAVEGMLVIARGLLDMTIVSGDAQQENSQRHGFFSAVAAARSQLLTEARSRFDGRFRILWLQDS
jgi:hypothetical protein